VFTNGMSVTDVDGILAGGTPLNEKAFFADYLTTAVKPRRPKDELNDGRSEIRKREDQSILRCNSEQVKSFVETYGPDAKSHVNTRDADWLQVLERKVMKLLGNS